MSASKSLPAERAPAVAGAPVVVPLPNRASWALGSIVVLALIGAVVGLARNPQIDWSVFGQYLFNRRVLAGLLATIELSALALVVGIVVGLLVAGLKLSPNRVLSSVADLYIWLFRGVPAIVQLLIWGNVGLFLPELRLPLPQGDLVIDMRLAAFTASVLGLGLHESAFMAEIIRGGVLSVEAGQLEAASALGMTRRRAMQRIVFPQALRVIIPPVGNQLTSLVKMSALVSVISGGELLNEVQNIAANNYRVIEMLFVATFWYLVLMAVIGLVQSIIERRLRQTVR